MKASRIEQTKASQGLRSRVLSYTAALALTALFGAGCFTQASKRTEAATAAPAPAPLLYPATATPAPATEQERQYLEKAKRLVMSVRAALEQMAIDMRDLRQTSATDFDKEFWLVRAKGTAGVFGMPKEYLEEIKNLATVPTPFQAFHKELTALSAKSAKVGHSYAEGLRASLKGSEPGAEGALGRLSGISRDELMVELEVIRPTLDLLCQKYGVSPLR